MHPHCSEDPDPFPLPPSPPTMDPAGPVHLPMNPQEVHAFFRDDENSSSDDSTVSSSSVHIQPPATTDIDLTTPAPDRTVQPSPAIPLHSTSAPGPDSDEDEEEMPDLYIPALIAPTMFLPIPNVRLSNFPKPVLTWWLSTHIKLPLFVFLDRSFVYVIEQIYLTREETNERFDWRVAETGFSFVGCESPYLERTAPCLPAYAALKFKLRMMND